MGNQQNNESPAFRAGARAETERQTRRRVAIELDLILADLDEHLNREERDDTLKLEAVTERLETLYRSVRFDPWIAQTVRAIDAVAPEDSA